MKKCLKQIKIRNLALVVLLWLPFAIVEFAMANETESLSRQQAQEILRKNGLMTEAQLIQNRLSKYEVLRGIPTDEIRKREAAEKKKYEKLFQKLLDRRDESMGNAIDFDYLNTFLKNYEFWKKSQSQQWQKSHRSYLEADALAKEETIKKYGAIDRNLESLRFYQRRTRFYEEEEIQTKNFKKEDLVSLDDFLRKEQQRIENELKQEFITLGEWLPNELVDPQNGSVFKKRNISIGLTPVWREYVYEDNTSGIYKRKYYLLDPIDFSIPVPFDANQRLAVENINNKFLFHREFSDFDNIRKNLVRLPPEVQKNQMNKEVALFVQRMKRNYSPLKGSPQLKEFDKIVRGGDPGMAHNQIRNFKVMNQYLELELKHPGILKMGIDSPYVPDALTEVKAVPPKIAPVKKIVHQPIHSFSTSNKDQFLGERFEPKEKNPTEIFEIQWKKESPGFLVYPEHQWTGDEKLVPVDLKKIKSNGFFSEKLKPDYTVKSKVLAEATPSLQKNFYGKLFYELPTPPYSLLQKLKLTSKDGKPLVLNKDYKILTHPGESTYTIEILNPQHGLFHFESSFLMNRDLFSNKKKLDSLIFNRKELKKLRDELEEKGFDSLVRVLDYQYHWDAAGKIEIDDLQRIVRFSSAYNSVVDNGFRLDAKTATLDDFAKFLNTEHEFTGNCYDQAAFFDYILRRILKDKTRVKTKLALGFQVVDHSLSAQGMHAINQIDIDGIPALFLDVTPPEKRPRGTEQYLIFKAALNQKVENSILPKQTLLQMLADDYTVLQKKRAELVQTLLDEEIAMGQKRHPLSEALKLSRTIDDYVAGKKDLDSVLRELNDLYPDVKWERESWQRELRAVLSEKQKKLHQYLMNSQIEKVGSDLLPLMNYKIYEKYDSLQNALKNILVSLEAPSAEPGSAELVKLLPSPIEPKRNACLRSVLGRKLLK